MRFQTQKKHVVDLLFPMALFFVFAISALTVILLATNIYQRTTQSSSLNYTSGTSLAYISEKIRQNDVADGVSLGMFDGHDSLILRQTYEGSVYHTYIYVDDGNLKELFIKDGVDASASAGTSIMPVSSFQMQELKDGLYQFTCIDANGTKASTIVGVRSK